MNVCLLAQSFLLFSLQTYMLRPQAPPSHGQQTARVFMGRLREKVHSLSQETTSTE